MEAERIISLFLELTQWRGPGFNSPAPLTFSDLAGYCQFYGAVLSSFEARMVKLIDNIYIASYHEQQGSGT